MFHTCTACELLEHLQRQDIHASGGKSVYNLVALILWEINTKRSKHIIQTYLNWKPVPYPSLFASGSIGHIMCQFKYTHHSCGHTLPKLEEPNDPSCKLCVPVLVALTYYHDQPTQICIENSFQQPPRMPRPCRSIGPDSSRDAEDIAHTHAQDLIHFEEIMDQLGVNAAERKIIQELARKPNQTSKRSTNLSIPLTPFSPRKIQFLMELETWQHRPYQPPNITFNTVSCGCGGTGPGVQSDCLVGWTGQGILMYRHGVWNANPLHHWDPQSPPALGFLRIDYGDAPVLQLPERWRASATRTSIDIPMSTCLYAVLRGRSPGPLVYDDEGYLVPALGASGPDIPTGLHLQPRPTQVFVAPEHPRHARGQQRPAPWNSSASITQAPGGPRPSQPYKQKSNKIYKERYVHNQTEAGPSQPVDRAEINTRIKGLPQRRASRSGTTTPASIAPAGVSQPVHSTHLTPRSTTPATTARNVPQSDDPTTGLDIIDESPPAASVEATNDDVEGKAPDNYHIPTYLS